MHIPGSLCNDARGNGSKVISQTLTASIAQQYFYETTSTKHFRKLSQTRRALYTELRTDS